MIPLTFPHSLLNPLEQDICVLTAPSDHLSRSSTDGVHTGKTTVLVASPYLLPPISTDDHPSFLNHFLHWASGMPFFFLLFTHLLCSFLASFLDSFLSSKYLNDGMCKPSLCSSSLLSLYNHLLVNSPDLRF